MMMVGRSSKLDFRTLDHLSLETKESLSFSRRISTLSSIGPWALAREIKAKWNSILVHNSFAVLAFPHMLDKAYESIMVS